MCVLCVMFVLLFLSVEFVVVCLRFFCLCICVFVYLFIDVVAYLRILCICVFLHLCVAYLQIFVASFFFFGHFCILYLSVCVNLSDLWLRLCVFLLYFFALCFRGRDSP